MVFGCIWPSAAWKLTGKKPVEQVDVKCTCPWNSKSLSLRSSFRINSANTVDCKESKRSAFPSPPARRTKPMGQIFWSFTNLDNPVTKRPYLGGRMTSSSDVAFWRSCNLHICRCLLAESFVAVYLYALFYRWPLVGNWGMKLYFFGYGADMVLIDEPPCPTKRASQFWGGRWLDSVDKKW